MKNAGLPSGPVSAPSRLHGRLPILPASGLTHVRAPGGGLGPACFPTLAANMCPHHASSGSSLNCSACFLLPPSALCSPGRGCLGFPVFAATNHFRTSLPCLSPRTLGGLSPELRPLELLGLHGALSGLSTGKTEAPALPTGPPRGRESRPCSVCGLDWGLLPAETRKEGRLPVGSLGTRVRTGRQGCVCTLSSRGRGQARPLWGLGASWTPLCSRWAVGCGIP